MGKAARRQRTSAQSQAPRAVPAPFVARPFAGLPGEADWVAMREIVPAATATARFRPSAPTAPTIPTAPAAPTASTPAAPAASGAGGAPADVASSRGGGPVTVTTVLPMAWPALHRQDGELLLALQTGSASGDASRDAAIALLAAAAADPGSPVADPGRALLDSPRLQDVLDLAAPFEVTVHDGFDYWVAGDLDDEGRASLERANAAIIPTVRLDAAPAAYWCRVGERTHLRWILPDDEDAATAGLARLHASAGGLGGTAGLGEGTRFLGAFRACGLLAPVWELDPQADPTSWAQPAQEMQQRYAAALAESTPLSTDERRARSGLLSRQITLR